MIAQTPAHIVPLRPRLVARLTLRTDEQVGSLVTAIEAALSDPRIWGDNAVNYAHWPGLETPKPPPRPVTALNSAATWLGLNRGIQPTMSDEAWDVVFTDCVSFAERCEAAQPFDYRRVAAAITGTDGDQLAMTSKSIYSRYEALLAVNPQASSTDQAVMLRWVAGTFLREHAWWDTKELGSGPVTFDENRCWAGDDQPTLRLTFDTPTWEPLGDGLASARIHPVVAQVIEHWFQVFPSAFAPIPAANVAPYSGLDAVRDNSVAAESALAPSPAAHTSSLVIAKRWWLVLMVACLGITVLTGLAVWLDINNWIGRPTFASSVRWFASNLATSAGVLLGWSALSYAVGLARVRWLPRLRPAFLQHVIFASCALALGSLSALLADMYIIVHEPDYLPVAGWWEGVGGIWLTSVLMVVLAVVCVIAAPRLASEWARITPPVISLASTTGEQP